MQTIRLVLGYDSNATQTSVTVALQTEWDVVVAGLADTPEVLLELVDEIQPNVVLLAIAPQLGFSHSFVEVLARNYPHCRIVMLGPNADTQLAAFFVSVGAMGYVCQQSSAAVFVQAIRDVVEGKGFIDPCVKRAASKKHRSDVLWPVCDGTRSVYLSVRETEVLRLVAQGFTNQEIARKLSFSIKSAETYRMRVMRKLGFRTRVDLFRYASQRGLVGADQSGSQDADSPAQLAAPDTKSKANWMMDTGDFLLDSTHAEDKRHLPNSVARNSDEPIELNTADAVDEANG